MRAPARSNPGFTSEPCAAPPLPVISALTYRGCLVLCLLVAPLSGNHDGLPRFAFGHVCLSHFTAFGGMRVPRSCRCLRPDSRTRRPSWPRVSPMHYVTVCRFGGPCVWNDPAKVHLVGLVFLFSTICKPPSPSRPQPWRPTLSPIPQRDITYLCSTSDSFPNQDPPTG